MPNEKYATRSLMDVSLVDRENSIQANLYFKKLVFEGMNTNFKQGQPAIIVIALPPFSFLIVGSFIIDIQFLDIFYHASYPCLNNPSFSQMMSAFSRLLYLKLNVIYGCPPPWF